MEPITFDVCPHCGSTERLVKNAIDKLKAEGKLADDVTPCMIRYDVALTDPRKPTIFGAPTQIQINIVDACAKCGALRVVTSFEVGAIPTTSIPLPKPPRDGRAN